MEIEKPNKKSETEDLNILLKQHKTLLNEKIEPANIKSPVLFLIRQSGKVEFKQKATTGRYDFKHSDGQERYLIINKNQLDFQNGDKNFKGYICHEDHPFPLPEEPILTTEQFNMIIDKTLHDKKEWETKLTTARTKMIWAIIWGIAIIIGMIILFKILVPPPPIETVGAQLAQAVQQNNTMIINQTGITVT